MFQQIPWYCTGFWHSVAGIFLFKLKKSLILQGHLCLLIFENETRVPQVCVLGPNSYILCTNDILIAKYSHTVAIPILPFYRIPIELQLPYNLTLIKSLNCVSIHEEKCTNVTFTLQWRRWPLVDFNDININTITLYFSQIPEIPQLQLNWKTHLQTKWYELTDSTVALLTVKEVTN